MFELIRTVCSESPTKREVSYSDSTNYFAVQFQPEGKKWYQWFARLFSGNRKRATVTTLPVELAVALAPGFQVEEPPKNFGASRVYFDAPMDLIKLRNLIIAAYEAEVQRVETGGKFADKKAAIVASGAPESAMLPPSEAPSVL